MPTINSRLLGGAFGTLTLLVLPMLGACTWNAPASAGAANGASPATFFVVERDLRRPLTLIAYGDMRFTDPANVTATNPAARQALIARIAQERPDDLFRGDAFPNYHYVKLTLDQDILRGTMYRLDPESAEPAWTAADRFEIGARP
jgi:hypothetical protein